MPSSNESGTADKSSRFDSRDETQPESWTRFWLSYARILLIQIVVLVALSGAVVAYLNWSSAQSFAEFVSAGAMLAPANPSLQSIRGTNPCDRGV